MKLLIRLTAFSAFAIALFVAIPISIVFAGQGNLRVAVVEGLDAPSYADSVNIGWTGSANPPVGCESKEYPGGHCFRYVYQDSAKKQIKLITFEKIEPGTYHVVAHRAGYRDGSNLFPIPNPDDNYDEKVVIANQAGPPPGEPASPFINTPGEVPRGSSFTVTAAGFNEAAWVSRFALVVVDENGTNFDCQEMRQTSQTTGSTNVRTPSATDQATVIFQLFRTNSTANHPVACDDIDGQSAISSVKANLSAVAGAPTPEPEQQAPAPPPPPTEIPIAPLACITPNPDGTCKEVSTALGIIPVTPAAFVESLFGKILGVAGTIAILLIMYAGYVFITSQGNPEKVQGARETLTAAVVGLLFIIFSLVILEVIGVNILHLPVFVVK